MPVRADHGRSLFDLGRDQGETLLRQSADIDLYMQSAVGGELGDDAPGDDVDVLESLEYASERAGISFGDDAESKQGTGWR